MTLKEYQQDPCGMLSIPYWKAKHVKVPESMRIVHERDFSEEFLQDYFDVRYFRLKHDLQGLVPVTVPGIEIRTARKTDIGRIADVINRSYQDISVTCEQLQAQMRTEAYCENLWILAWDTEQNCVAGCGIADYDAEAGEGILEWIQVLTEYRRKQIGRLLVQELLCRMKGRARFATVSGQCDSTSQPEKLYRGCGFYGSDIWHVLKKRA